MTLSQLVNIRFVEFGLIDLNSILPGMWGTQTIIVSMAPTLSWLDTRALCAKIFVCCLVWSSAQISPQQRCKNCKFYLLLFDVQFFNLEIKIQKCTYILSYVRLMWVRWWLWYNVVTVGFILSTVASHYMWRPGLSHQWTCGDWGWGHDAACRLSPRLVSLLSRELF